MPLALRRQAIALVLITLSLPTWAVAGDIVQPTTQAEYDAFKIAQSDASNAAYRAGDIETTKAIEEAVLAAARTFRDRNEEASSIYALAMAAAAMGQLDSAEAQFRQSIEIWKGLNDQKGIAIALRGLGRVLESRGRLAEATEVQVAALELLLKHGKPIDQSESYYSLAKLFLNMEDYKAARHGVDRAITLMGDKPHPFALGLNLALRSTVRRNQGDIAGAVADGKASIAAFAVEKSVLGEAIGQMALGNALAANGKPDQGLALLRAGANTAVEIKEAVLHADLLLSLGTVLVTEKRFKEALPYLQQARGIADELDMDTTRRDANVQLEIAWSGLGKPAEALAASKQAFAAQHRMAGMDKIGQMAGRSAESQLSALNSKFLSLDPATRASQAVLAPPTPEPNLSWRWWLPLLLALVAGLALVMRYSRRLRSRHGDLQSEHAQLRGHSEELQQQVSIDPLTGVLTRRAFTDELAEMLTSAQAQGEPVTLMVFDLDHFKQVNDRHGHSTGDAALKLLVGLVRTQLDSDDLFGRFGGDEFLIGCRQPTDDVVAMAERIRAAVDLHSRAPESGLPPLSISVGLAHAGAGDGYDADALFKRADAALYVAKDAGRNRVMVDGA